MSDCQHDPRYSRSECVCGQQVAWCDRCSVSLCGCDASEEDAAETPRTDERATVSEAVEAAHAEIHRICQGGDERWRMSIPANPTRDSDLILTAALDGLTDRLAAAVARAEAAEDWKAQALPVISGLQELGKALGLRLGTSITGPEATEAARRLNGRAEAAEAKVDEVLRRIGRNLAQQHVAAERHRRAGLDDRNYSEYHRMVQGRWAFYESARLICQETRRDFDAFLSEHDPRHEEYNR